MTKDDLRKKLQKAWDNTGRTDHWSEQYFKLDLLMDMHVELMDAVDLPRPEPVKMAACTEFAEGYCADHSCRHRHVHVSNTDCEMIGKNCSSCDRSKEA